MNSVQLVGRLSRDPELTFAAGSGTAITRFSIAVNRKFKNKQTGAYEADFISCLSFGKQAELIAQKFTKGTSIAINGHIQTGSYTAKDGSTRYTTDVLVESLTFTDNKKSSNDYNPANDNFRDDLTPVNDCDMPF